MTRQRDDFELTEDATEITARYVRAFNAGDADAVNRFYTDDAVSVWEPGVPLTGDARREHIEEVIARGASVQATQREVYTTGDTALLIVDWTLSATNAEGVVEDSAGVGVDVLRRGEDGKWRYAIDDPYGRE
ncbi:MULTISPECIES: YybH family protein [unclassified Saccharothrix]|uniref:YybH family protein n=1 Tax=unclassified Saccharothrix TaxID=2593673 RepID=UPI00307D9771